MFCLMEGARIRTDTGDPDSTMDYADDATCRCDAISISATVEQEIGGAPCICFDGCRLLQGMQLEIAPASWGSPSWPQVQIAEGPQSTVNTIAADALFLQAGKIPIFIDGTFCHVDPE